MLSLIPVCSRLTGDRKTVHIIYKIYETENGDCNPVARADRPQFRRHRCFYTLLRFPRIVVPSHIYHTIPGFRNWCFIVYHDATKCLAFPFLSALEIIICSLQINKLSLTIADCPWDITSRGLLTLPRYKTKNWSQASFEHHTTRITPPLIELQSGKAIRNTHI